MDPSIVQDPIAIVSLLPSGSSRFSGLRVGWSEVTIQVGLAAQLPSGNTSTDNLDSKQFFEFLLNKGEAYEKIPLERFNIDAWA